MAFKFVALLAFVAAAQAGVIPAATSHSYSSSSVSHGLQLAAPIHTYAAPIHTYAPIHKTLIAEPEAPAHYDFEYSVHDPHTGDIKSQKESRKDDQVIGSYSLIEADGTKRIVEYTADDHNGFNAVVHREPSQHPVQVVKAVKTLVASPALHLIHAAPIAYHQAQPSYLLHH